jgi:hypothetical protein
MLFVVHRILLDIDLAWPRLASDPSWKADLLAFLTHSAPSNFLTAPKDQEKDLYGPVFCYKTSAPIVATSVKGAGLRANFTKQVGLEHCMGLFPDLHARDINKISSAKKRKSSKENDEVSYRMSETEKTVDTRQSEIRAPRWRTDTEKS